jgi:hypothetical protein
VTTQSVHIEETWFDSCRRAARRRLSTSLVAVAAVALAASLGGGFAGEARADSGVRPTVAVPAYFWANSEWDRLLIGAPEVDYIVLNPDSGPGPVKYNTFVTKVAAARSQGSVVLGYVDTAYGTRPEAAVKADIDLYRSWYGVNAFFFDQTPSACSALAYYNTLSTYVRAQANAVIFHNPGTNPEECFLSAADVVVNFEGSEATYDTWTPASYTSSYPASRFWHIVYSVDPTHGSQLLTTAQARNGGLVYLTEQNMPNPFSVIPTASLWSAQTPSVPPSRPAAPQAGTATTIVGRPAAPQSGPTTTTSTTAAPSASPAVEPPVVAPSTTLPPATTESPAVTVVTVVPTIVAPPSPAATLLPVPIVVVPPEPAAPAVVPAESPSTQDVSTTVPTTVASTVAPSTAPLAIQVAGPAFVAPAPELRPPNFAAASVPAAKASIRRRATPGVVRPVAVRATPVKRSA